ncbi:polysaccharide deacetylase family protein [Bradyrhizobium stylosanthis]|uniref:Polysaccharide deacetylase n=1 Tax=Bradyrhizobium stylosanthis TaxID=1803665 RepID=A0A560E2P9_9BRAD|nr:polysaccharide deacetylase family protein [Bradyrhizobium stylosanthis]TWB03658.1 polysaccharide deacetylase [Bradyrhizobium stylosanthis]
MAKFDTKMDRYPFVPITKRPTYDWPAGKRLAVYFALNIEAFEFGRNPGPDFTTMPAPPFHRGYAYRDFGNRVGVWRLIDLFQEFDIPLSVLANTAVYDAYPEVMAAFRQRGDEFVGHGRTNSERQIDMSEDEERAMLREVRDRFEKEEGAAPKGWLGPFISQSTRTPELLVEQGFGYMLDWFYDEQPQLFRTDLGPILSVPYPSMELNDLPAVFNRRVSDAEFADLLVDAFDQQLQDSEKYPLVFSVALHTFVMGQPHRTRNLRRALAHIASHRDKVWITTAGKIATHALSLPKGTLLSPDAAGSRASAAS